VWKGLLSIWVQHAEQEVGVASALSYCAVSGAVDEETLT
jgi:hypothetical protein